MTAARTAQGKALALAQGKALALAMTVARTALELLGAVSRSSAVHRVVGAARHPAAVYVMSWLR